MKNDRREKIIQLIEQKPIETQEDLMLALKDIGYEVTQSTISRDIKQLQLVKVLDKNGRYKYSKRFSESTSANVPVNKENLLEIFAHSAVNVRYAMNDVIIKCHNGMAQSACVALDELFHDGFLGTLAGDDTIFVICESEKSAEMLSQQLEKIMR